MKRIHERISLNSLFVTLFGIWILLWIECYWNNSEYLANSRCSVFIHISVFIVKITLWSCLYYYLHVTDWETEVHSLNNLSKITQLWSYQSRLPPEPRALTWTFSSGKCALLYISISQNLPIFHTILWHMDSLKSDYKPHDKTFYK